VGVKSRADTFCVADHDVLCEERVEFVGLAEDPLGGSAGIAKEITFKDPGPAGVAGSIG
jgi:hypothetical protein